MCGNIFRGRVLWFLLLFCSVLPLAMGQEEIPEYLPMSESSKTQENQPMPLPSELVQRWNEYDQQYKDSMLSLEQFLDQVEAFGIKFEDLPGFMTLLVNSYEASEKAREQERQISQEAIKTEHRRGNFYKITTIAVGSVALLLAFK